MTVRGQAFKRWRMAWLLWLAISLPLSQAAVGWHLSTHGGARAGAPDDSRRVDHSLKCEVCLLGAALAVGGGAADAPGAPSCAAQHGAPAPRIKTPVRACHRSIYLSRAPPASIDRYF